MTEHDLSGLTGAYALDALDETERARFEEHLATCADCAAEVRSLRAAAAELSHTSVTDPPADLRAGVMASIGQVRPMPPVGLGGPPRLAAPARVRVWQSVAAAFVLIAAVATGWGFQQRSDASHHNAQINAVAQVLESPDARTVTGRIGGGGRATLLYSEERHRLVMIGHDVAALAGSQTYQMWTIDADGVATSAGLFTPDSNGTVLVQVSRNLSHTAQFGVSVEPAGGVRQPTPGAIVAHLNIEPA